MPSSEGLSDQGHRNLILENQDSDKFKRNIFVEAGAGSGKTECLVERMVNHVVFMLEDGEDISNLVAITFTKKAAQEFRSRFQEKLEEQMGRKEIDDMVKERISHILNNIEEIFMGTIHAFCAKLLRERPVEAGLNIDFKELDKKENELFLNDSWNQFLRSEVNKPTLKPLQKMGFPVSKLFNVYMELEKNREIDFTSVVPKPLDDLESSYRSALQKTWVYFGNLSKIRKENTKTTIFKTANPVKIALKNFQRNMENYQGKEYKLNTIEIKNILDGFIACKLLQDPKDPPKQQATIDWYRLVADERKKLERFIVENYSRCDLSLYKYCLDFALAAVKFAVEKRRKDSSLSFLDLLIYTRDMIKGNKEARDYFQQKYRYFYVDEFQDTDPLQTEIIFYLTSDQFKEEWQELVPRHGSLFIVGDPKQSIYRFSRADINNYELVKGRILDTLPAGVAESQREVRLTANFRSVEPLCEEINGLFARLLGNGTSGTQVAHTEMESGRKPLDKGFEEKKVYSGIRVLPQINLPKAKKDILIQEDAPRVAEFIHNAVEGGNLWLAKPAVNMDRSEKAVPACYGDFMIITYDKDEMDTYAKELQLRDIPYLIFGRSAFTKSMEIAELVKVLDSINDPYDEVKVVAALRSIFFGVSDQDLYIYRMAGNSFALLNQSEDGAAGEDEDSLAAVAQKPDFKGFYQQNICSVKNKIATLRVYSNQVKTYSPIVLMERLINELKIVLFSLSSAGEANRLDLLYQLLETVRTETLQGNIYDLSSLLRRLRLWLDADVENEMPLEGEQDAVRIMNLHKAKGLQAPVVILAKPCGKVYFEPSLHVERIGGSRGKGYLRIQEKAPWADWPTNLLDIKDWEDKFATESRLLEEEHTRKLYVAATRARNLLVISNSDKDISSTYRPWQDLWQTLELLLKEKGESIEDRVISMDSVSLIPVVSDWDPIQEGIPNNANNIREEIEKHWDAPKTHTYGLASPSELREQTSKKTLWGDFDDQLKRRIFQYSQPSREDEGDGDESAFSDKVTVDPAMIVDEILKDKHAEAVKQGDAYEKMLEKHGFKDENDLKQALLENHKRKTEGGKRGPLWGTMVHLLLEQIVKQRVILNNAVEGAVLKEIVQQTLGEALYEKNRDKSQYNMLVKAFQRDGEAKPDEQELKNRLSTALETVAKNFMNCTYEQADANRKMLWQRILNAAEVLSEYTFDLPVILNGDKELFELCRGEIDEEEVSMIILSGVIDLLIKENGFWTIIDYKTNAVKSPVELDEIYQDQLKAYKLVWEKISSEQVKEVFTYHVKPD